MKITVSLNKEDLEQIVIEKEKKTGFTVANFTVRYDVPGDFEVTYERVPVKPDRYDYLS